MGIAERIERILRAEWNDRFRREAPVGEPGLALREGEREVLQARELVAGLSRERQDALDEVRRCEDAAATALRAHDDERARTWLRLMREAEQRATYAADRVDREYRRVEPLDRAVRELGERMAGVGTPATPSTAGVAYGASYLATPVVAPTPYASPKSFGASAAVARLETATAAIDETFGRMEARIAGGEASVMLGESLRSGEAVEDRFKALETDDRVQQLRARATAAPVTAAATGTDDDALARLRQRMVRP